MPPYVSRQNSDFFYKGAVAFSTHPIEKPYRKPFTKNICSDALQNYRSVHSVFH